MEASLRVHPLQNSGGMHGELGVLIRPPTISASAFEERAVTGVL